MSPMCMKDMGIYTLTDAEGLDRDWMVKGRKPYAELEKVVTGKLLLTDIKKLSPAEQTSSLEAFHKVVCGFAPKSVHYFHAKMETRVYLACLHFNENTNRPQGHRRDGTAQYSVSFPKAKFGGGVAKEIKTQMTFEYVSDLMTEVFFLRDSHQSYHKAKAAREQEGPKRPIPLAHSTPRTSKAAIVGAHFRRFNRQSAHSHEENRQSAHSHEELIDHELTMC